MDIQTHVLTIKIDSVNNVIVGIHVAHIPSDISLEQQIMLLSHVLTALRDFGSQDTPHADSTS